MTRQDLEALSSKLFAAGRSELPSARVRAAALEHALHARPKTMQILFRNTLLAALAAAVVVVIAARLRTDESSPIGPERWDARPSETTQKDELARRDDPIVVQRSPAPSLPSDRTEPLPPRPTPSPSTVPAPSLSEEVRMLERARTALTSGESARALELLEHYEKRLRGTRLRAEATVLRIEALSAAGRSTEAAALAESFVRDNPASPLVDRAKSFTTESSSTAPEDTSGTTP